MCFTSSPILCSMEKQGQRSLRNNISLPATHHVPPRARSAPPSRGHGQMAQNMDRSDFDGIGFLFEACLSPITLNLHERLWQKSMPFGVSSLSFSPVRPNVVLSPYHKHMFSPLGLIIIGYYFPSLLLACGKQSETDWNRITVSTTAVVDEHLVNIIDQCNFSHRCYKLLYTDILLR